MPDFFMDDLGITLSDPRKEMEAKQIISQAASQMLPNMQDPQMILEMIKIHWADSASEAISILERGVQQMNNAMEEELNKHKVQKAEAEAKAKAEEAKLISDERNQTQVAVANIYADNKTQSDQIKETNANLRKAAEIEAKIHENVQKNKNKNVFE